MEDVRSKVATGNSVEGKPRRTDARAHVGNCEICMRLKPNQMQAAGNMLTQVPEEPWATVCADFVGPQPSTGTKCCLS